MKLTLHKLLEFSKMTHTFQQLKRQDYAVGEDRRENDAEHSFQLAMIAWYLLEGNDLSLDKNLVLQYALIHDLVEVYAGDTYIFDQDSLASKDAREKKAAQLLHEQFPEFMSLHKLIKNYEKLNDEEGKFVYSLDKVLNFINNYFDRGKLWKEQGVDLEIMIGAKSKKIHRSEEITYYFALLIELLRKEGIGV